MKKATLPALILTGPTGVGKTELAVRLAHRRPFELISTDSMQVYRGMEIGTAQPTAKELGGARLHGCGILDPKETFNAKIFLEFCDRTREQIARRGNFPLFVGGTGMYLRALRWGLFEEEPESASSDRETKKQARSRLLSEVEELGSEALHGRLRRVDPELAKRISPQDAVRITRALEVAETTGRPMSALQQQWSAASPRFPHLLVVLNCARPALIERIERRVDEMIEAGWIGEVRRLLHSGYSPDLHCFKAVGYREIFAHLSGELTLEQTRSQIKARTRQFAKRQMTWFRKERDAHWIEFNGRDAGQALEEIENLLASTSPDS